MATGTLDPNQIFSATADTLSELTDLMAAVDENKVNTIPYEGSWTAPQLLRHVTKSINGMTRALQMDAKPAQRDPGERIEELKKIFLDFSIKLTQPEFIVPEEMIYEKQSAIEEINKSFDQFKESANSANLNDLVEGFPLGPITKWEIIHFVLYHTQRHLHQMKKICGALKNNTVSFD
ncbi:MAG: DinB family protein [Bacteroidota bacterium]